MRISESSHCLFFFSFSLESVFNLIFFSLIGSIFSSSLAFQRAFRADDPDSSFADRTPSLAEAPDEFSKFAAYLKGSRGRRWRGWMHSDDAVLLGHSESKSEKFRMLWGHPVSPL